jgi:hypothetical protein
MEIINNMKTEVKKVPRTKEFEDAVRPVIKYLAENHHPHTTIIITGNCAELVVGDMVLATNEYLVD